MKAIKIDFQKQNLSNVYNNKIYFILKKEFNDKAILLFFVHILITSYLFLDYRNQNRLIKDILNFQNSFIFKSNIMENKYPNNDKEMIGLYYPDIDFNKIKEKLKNNNIMDFLLNLLNLLEIKLIYLEKEINLTKIISFYTARKYYLKEELKIKYDEKNIIQLHEMINWIIIHQSNQLKGIASDKYLACKYVKYKLGIDICQQRIKIYNNIEDLNYKELSKYGNIVLKVSNSCWKTVFINKNETFHNFNKKIKEFKKLYEYDHGVVNVQPFHNYAKKRIIVEKQLIPLTELYEFKLFILNRKIAFIDFVYYLKTYKKIYLIYDENYNFKFRDNTVQTNPLNLKSIIRTEILEKLKKYAISLSEDFPNFIRVDLYVFHDNIYLSELTFASYDGRPWNEKEAYIQDALKNYSRKDNYY